MGQKNRNGVPQGRKNANMMMSEMASELGIQSYDIENKVNLAAMGESKYSKKTMNKLNRKNKGK
ncbi:hypothetical protein [Tepidibacter thalassicus]|uniref:Small, acid-soluble spore protein, alpha/beta type n=1 Tax=Tepidibacter thalassicus DSM 15285 TaxID=1123350 RepID=A0A1M5NQQ5_9FIRM|nr:hypothetical protein [Tepidibacter thalassicus]SHG91807.1 hypothetical protein SAMN02744040_00169 [Tepidibacter thalassicus DSM 15285]